MEHAASKLGAQAVVEHALNYLPVSAWSEALIMMMVLCPKLGSLGFMPLGG